MESEFSIRFREDTDLPILNIVLRLSGEDGFRLTNEFCFTSARNALSVAPWVDIGVQGAVSGVCLPRSLVLLDRSPTDRTVRRLPLLKPAPKLLVLRADLLGVDASISSASDMAEASIIESLAQDASIIAISGCSGGGGVDNSRDLGCAMASDLDLLLPQLLSLS